MVCWEIWSTRNQTLNINNQLVLKTNNTDLKLFMDKANFKPFSKRVKFYSPLKTHSHFHFKVAM